MVSSHISLCCSFCGAEETRNHLFFNCIFTGQIWKEVMLRVKKIVNIHCNWEQVVEWGVHALKKNTKLNSLTKIALQACIYFIWLERNSWFHTLQYMTVEYVVHKKLQNIKNRLVSLNRLSDLAVQWVWKLCWSACYL